MELIDVLDWGSYVLLAMAIAVFLLSLVAIARQGTSTGF